MRTRSNISSESRSNFFLCHGQLAFLRYNICGRGAFEEERSLHVEMRIWNNSGNPLGNLQMRIFRSTYPKFDHIRQTEARSSMVQQLWLNAQLLVERNCISVHQHSRGIHSIMSRLQHLHKLS